mgnify:CR=1 FL=1
MNKEFNCEPLSRLSLPALAEQIMWNNFDTTWGKVFSFPHKWKSINEAIRAAITGGPSIVFHRHAETKYDASFPWEVTHTPSGDRISTINSYDFNSLCRCIIIFYACMGG